MKVDDLSHLQPPFQEAARLSNAERIPWLRQERWIQYPRAERILERLIDLGDYPPHDRMPCLVIYGATGMGKTRIQEFLRENRTHFDRKLGKDPPSRSFYMRKSWPPCGRHLHIWITRRRSTPPHPIARQTA